MQSNPHEPEPKEKMLAMAQALFELRDTWVEMSLILSDILTERDSPQRDEVLTEVERYIVRLREADR